MPYAKVVLGLPVEGPFDYIVPAHLQENIKEGMRVWIQFRDKRKLGYVVKVTRTTSIKHIKPVLEIIDNSPPLDKDMLLLTKRLSDYYGCSWGEAIETALPDALRKGKKIILAEKKYIKAKHKQEAYLIHDLNKGARWDIYLSRIKEAVANNSSVILLLADINSASKAKEIILANLKIPAVILHRGQSQEAEVWARVKESEFNIVIGTRSAIFAPVNNLGLVIIDDEQDTVYKQDQVPHYHARQIAFMRAGIQRAKLILGSISPSLESFYLAKKGKIKYELLPRSSAYPQVKIVDMHHEKRYFKQRDIILSKYLQDCIARALEAKGKILLFLNRKGFATFTSCRNCGEVLRCPRCNINLVYYFKESILNCRYCNFKMAAPQICPNCNAAYMRYSGMGTEKIESEISRIFPSTRVLMIDSPQEIDIDKADIFISTASIIKKPNYNFDLIGVLSIDNSLSRIDFRSTEKTFALLSGLLTFTEKNMVIQTGLPRHYSLQAIENNDINMYFNEELRLRKQLGFPPYRHICLVKLRGRKESSVQEASNTLFENLNKYAQGSKAVRVVSLNPGQPEKLRGNFCWQILIKASYPIKIVSFLRLHLKKFRYSGIIVTIDVDPV